MFCPVFQLYWLNPSGPSITTLSPWHINTESGVDKLTGIVPWYIVIGGDVQLVEFGVVQITE